MNIGIHLLNVIEISLWVYYCYRFSFSFWRGLSRWRLESHLRHLWWFWRRYSSLISLFLGKLKVLSSSIIKMVNRRLVSQCCPKASNRSPSSIWCLIVISVWGNVSVIGSKIPSSSYCIIVVFWWNYTDRPVISSSWWVKSHILRRIQHLHQVFHSWRIIATLY